MQNRMSSRLASRCAVVLAIAAVSAPAAQARRAAQEPGVPLSPAQIDAITRHHHEPGTPGPTRATRADPDESRDRHAGGGLRLG